MFDDRAGCPINDAVCERDWIGFEAISQLHAQIDDDQNGCLDRLESNEVICRLFVSIRCHLGFAMSCYC